MNGLFATGSLGDTVYERLLGQRIVVLGQEVDDEVANRVVAQLVLLAAENSREDIRLYVNSPGGSVTAGMAIYDTMQLVRCDVATYAMGTAASMGQFLLSSGTPGKRFALPHSRILLHQPLGGVGGVESDIAIQAEQLRYVRRRMAELTAAQTGQRVERVLADSERDRWFSAAEALDYGLVDRIVSRPS